MPIPGPPGFQPPTPQLWTERLTAEARSCLALAEEEGVKAGLGYIGGEHLLLGLLRQGEGRAARVLGLLSLTTDGAREAVRSASVDAPRQMVAQVAWNGDLDVVLRVATDLASLRQVQWTDTEDLLLALWRLPTSSRVWRVLSTRGITADTVRESLGRLDTEDLERALRLAGIPRLRVHDLRHLRGALLLLGGVDIATFRDVLGHSSIALTADTYAGIMPALKQDAADRFERVLSRLG